MGVIDEILKEAGIEKSMIDEQVRQICDQIFEEEKGKMEHLHDLPKGPNIFLPIECPGRTLNEVAYLTLEREAPGEFFMGLWTKEKAVEKPVKRIQTWPIKEATANKVLQEYAKKLRFLKGK